MQDDLHRLREKLRAAGDKSIDIQPLETAIERTEQSIKVRSLLLLLFLISYSHLVDFGGKGYKLVQQPSGRSSRSKPSLGKAVFRNQVDAATRGDVTKTQSFEAGTVS